MSTYKDLLVENIMCCDNTTLISEERQVNRLAESVLSNKAFDKYFRSNPMLVEGTKELFKRGLISEQTFEQWFNRHNGERFMDNVTLDTVTNYEKKYDPLATATDIGTDAYAQWIIKHRRELDNLGSRRTRDASHWSSENSIEDVILVGKDDLMNFEKFKNVIKNIKNVAKYDQAHRPELYSGANANNVYSANILDYPTAQSLHQTMVALEDDLFSDATGRDFKALKGNVHPNQMQRLSDMFGDEFRAPRSFQPTESDYSVVYEDDKWLVVWSFTVKANKFFGQMSRKAEVRDVWADQIAQEHQYRDANAIYSGAEWCTVPRTDCFYSYGGGLHDYNFETQMANRLFVNIPKVNGKPDFMSPYKVQCNGYQGRGRADWANVLDIVQRDGPFNAFRIKWTRGLWEFYRNTVGYVTDNHRFRRNNRALMGYDIRNGQVINAPLNYESLVEDETYPNQPRYRKIQKIGDTNLFIGFESVDSHGVGPYFLLNPQNGDKIDSDLILRGAIKMTGPDKTVLIAYDGVYICIERADGSRAVVKVATDGSSIEVLFDYTDRSNTRNGWLFNATENGQEVTKIIRKTATRSTTRRQNTAVAQSTDVDPNVAGAQDAEQPVTTTGEQPSDATQVEVETIGGGRANYVRAFGGYLLVQHDSDNDNDERFLCDIRGVDDGAVYFTNLEPNFVSYCWVQRSSDGYLYRKHLDFLLLPNGTCLDTKGGVHPMTTQAGVIRQLAAAGQIFITDEVSGERRLNDALGMDAFELLSTAKTKDKNELRRWYCLTKTTYTLPDGPDDSEFEERISQTFATAE